jgi:hypothetical protein
MMCKGHLHLKLLSYVPINIVLIVLGSARLALLGSARLISARLGSARLGSARLGSARLGSARLGSARLGVSKAWLGWLG